MITVPSVKRYTYADYKQLDVDDHFLYELLNGELVRKSAPSPQHQIVSGNLFRALDRFVFDNKLGRVLYAPVDVFVDNYNVPQPDLLFVSNAHAAYITADGVFGPPDLVVEIVSPSSVTRDRVDKMQLYRRFSIPEYWIVDLKYNSVEVLQLIDNEYHLFSSALETGTVQSRILDGLILDITNIFAA